MSQTAEGDWFFRRATFRGALFVGALLNLAVLDAAEKPAGNVASPRKTENVILITLDGLRWQELFGGADESLLNREHGGVRDLEGINEAFWRETARERREALMPFFWRVIARQGRIFGDPEDDSIVRVTNGRYFSYPGYSEILTGYPDATIDSNDKRPNPNVTVLEWLHDQDAYRGRIAAFCSWDVFPYIINAQRSGIPVNAGWEPLKEASDPARLRQLNDLARELPHYWDNVRYDIFTFSGALEYLRVRKPRVLYVAFGETDDWAHAGRYDLYLEAARRTDAYIERLWSAVENDPQYAGKTSLVITTDHGRGDTRTGWKSHGQAVPGSDLIWIAVFGPDTPPGRPAPETVTQSQVAATVAALLGEDYSAAVSRAGRPLPGIHRTVAP